MVKVAELVAEVKLDGAKKAAKDVENLTRNFGFLGNVASGTLKILEWGANTLNEGVQMAHAYARQMDVMTFRNKIGAESFQRLDQAFRQHGGRVEDFISVYDKLQQRQSIWKRYGRSDAENNAFAMLGIEPSNYANTLDLMDAITQKLINMQNIGDRNYIAGVLGINDEYLRIASKRDYNVWNNIIMTPEQQEVLNEQTKNWQTLDNLVEGLKIKLGTKWSADWGLDLSKSLIAITQDMIKAADAADGFFDALYRISKAGLNSLGSDNEDKTKRNRWGRIVDFMDDSFVAWYDVLSGNWEDINGDIERNQQKRYYMRKQENQSNKIKNTSSSQISKQKQSSNGVYVMQQLMDAGYSQDFAAAIVGGLVKESGLNPLAIGDNGTSYGIAQWHNDRAKGLPSNLAGQTDFLMGELINKFGMTPEKANRMSFEQAGYWALHTFENPADKSVQELSQRLSYGLPYLSLNNGKYQNLAENAPISESSRQIVNNNNANVTINANKVDEALLEDTIQRAIIQYMNKTSMGIAG